MSVGPHGHPRVARVFFWFGGLAGLVVVIGAGFLVVTQRAQLPMRFPSLTLLGAALRHPSAEGAVSMGLAGLLCLPLVRNLGLAFGLFRRGARAAGALALTSCLLLLWLYGWLSRQH